MGGGYFNLRVFSVLPLLLISLVHSQSVTSTTRTEPSSSSPSPSTVNYLPGFSGPLPFQLETGYTSTNAGDLPSSNNDDGDEVETFYYLVKSERNPKEDPIVFWFAGGPRCSGLSALLFEIGPISIDIAGYNGGLPNLVLNPNSWTKVASIVFPDAPVDTGFSYSKSSPNLYVGDKESSKSNYKFVVKWLIEHPEFQSNPLYIGGDSYSGKTVPIVVQYFINDIEAHEHQFLNFKGYLLGNPITYRQLETNARVPYAYGMGLLSYELFESMKMNCIGKNLHFNLDNVNCVKDRQKFEACTSKMDPTFILGKYCGPIKPIIHEEPTGNRRSLSTMGEASLLEPVQPIPGCRMQNQDVLAGYWANDIRVQEALHVKKGTVKKWIRCNNDIPYERDIISSVEYHRNISTRHGYRSLIYSGDHDFAVPHISTEAWIRSLNLSITDDWRPWLSDDQFAGYTTTYSSGLTYATVKGAGHIVSEYKPKESYAMFQRWISNSSL